MSPRKDDRPNNRTQNNSQSNTQNQRQKTGTKKVVAMKPRQKSAPKSELREMSPPETSFSSPDSSDLSEKLPQSLTLKEKNVLEFIENFMRESGIAPSYQEICQYFGFASFNSVQRYLKQLEAKGYVRVPGGNQKRALTILRSASALQDAVEEIQREAQDNIRNVLPVPSSIHTEVFNLPLLGRVAAGAPIEAYEHDEFIDVPASLVRHAERTYALRVEGQSMIEDGILDGDVILVQRQPHASNGEIVVAMIGDEATVKRFYSHKRDPVEETDFEFEQKPQQMIELRPANSTMQSLWFDPEEVQIRGIVVGLIRKF